MSSHMLISLMKRLAGDMRCPSCIERFDRMLAVAAMKWSSEKVCRLNSMTRSKLDLSLGNDIRKNNDLGSCATRKQCNKQLKH